MDTTVMDTRKNTIMGMGMKKNTITIMTVIRMAMTTTRKTVTRTVAATIMAMITKKKKSIMDTIMDMDMVTRRKKVSLMERIRLRWYSATPR